MNTRSGINPAFIAAMIMIVLLLASLLSVYTRTSALSGPDIKRDIVEQSIDARMGRLRKLVASTSAEERKRIIAEIEDRRRNEDVAMKYSYGREVFNRIWINGGLMYLLVLSVAFVCAVMLTYLSLIDRGDGIKRGYWLSMTVAVTGFVASIALFMI